jgi:hypothetical protein
VADVHDTELVPESRAWTWTVRTLYTGLIAANLWLAFDWWRQTDSGRDTIERWRQRIEEAKARAENCEGCARRKEWLRVQANRMHWQAERIVEGEDVPTEPEP